MRCKRARRELVPYLDGELAPLRRWRLDRHLGRCPACAREAREVRVLLDSILPEPPPPLPRRLEAAVLARAREALGGYGAAEKERARRWRLPKRRAGVALAGGVAVAVVVLVGLNRHPGRELAVSASGRGESTPSAMARQTRAAAGGAALEPSVLQGPRGRRAERPPSLPPRELREKLDLFVELPVIRNLDKLEHFEAIRELSLEDGDRTRYRSRAPRKPRA